MPLNRKKIALNNIRRCLNTSPQVTSRIAKQSTILFADIFIEVLAFPILKNIMPHYVKVSGLEHLTSYKATHQRGAVIITCHSDNWELMGGAFAQFGIPLVGVAKKQKSQGADKFINEFRTNIGMHITYRTGVREMV